MVTVRISRNSFRFSTLGRRALADRCGGSPGRILLVLVVVPVLLAGVPVRAEEPAEAFLEALRDKGYHDTASMYLERVDGSSLISPEFQVEIAYQRGVTMVQAATLVRDNAAREKMLTQAKASLEKFLAEQPESPKRLFARRQFILLLRQWANMKVEAAQRSGAADLLEEAGALYDDAYKTSVASTQELKEELGKLKKDYDSTTEREEIEYRDSLRGEYLLSLLGASESLEEKAETEPEDSAARKSLLSKAIEGYAEMYSKYGDYLAGLRARLFQARCLVKIGDLDTALEYLTKDLLSQTNNQPAARLLKTKALLLAIECWTNPAKKDYATAISQGMPWLETIRPAESEEPDWIQLRLALARAHLSYADRLAVKDPRDELVIPSRDAARRLARAVSRLPGPYQQEGRMLLAEIPGGVAAARTGTQEPATTFQEAQNRGTEAIAEMQSSQYFLASVPDRLKTETDVRVKQELQKKLATAEQTVVLKRREATENLTLAMSFSDADTPIEDMNLVRRLLAYLHYAEQEYYDAAVMGEFIGRRFPGSSGARQGAQIALAAYLKLYQENPADVKAFETEHVSDLANYIVETWSGTPEAAEAINTLIPFLIRQGRLDKAREYVENIPPTSFERGSAELRIGEALWHDYLVGMQQLREWEQAVGEGGAEVAELQSKIAARGPELQAVRATAVGILESGVDRMKKAGTVDATVPRAVLSLAQIYVDSDKAPQAIALLDDPKIGVLPMIDRGDPVVAEPLLQEKIYRVALSAMVSALPKVKSTEQRTALLARSQEMMKTLREHVGDSPESQQRLVDIFYSLARGLETQLNLLDKPADRRVLSDGFRTFLEQVRDEADDLRVLNWVAESFASLSKGLATDAQSSDAARACLLAAVATYDQILTHAEKYSLTPELKRNMQFHKAVALRGCADYTQAAEILNAVLKEDNNRLEYQKETALTYQLWAAEPKEGIRFLTAVRGTKADPETQQQTVWGWSRIAKITQRSKKYRDDFYEARYNTALCHYELALRLRKASNRQEYLTRAANDIVFTQRLYPTLGGQTWYGKYDALLKKIQQSQGESATGLPRAKKK